jgi:hypothetical protein
VAGEITIRQPHLKRADDGFGNYLAVGLTSEKIDGYKKERLAKGDRPASINRLLQLIRQAYGLTVKRGHLSRVTSIEFLSEKVTHEEDSAKRQSFARSANFFPTICKTSVCSPIARGCGTAKCAHSSGNT